MEKMEVKVGQKMKRVKTINERKSEWELVNGEGKEERRKAIFSGVKIGKEGDWQDVEDGGEEGEMEEVVKNGTMTAPAVHPQPELAVVNDVADQEALDEEDKIT